MSEPRQRKQWFTPKPAVVARRLEGEMVLVQLDSGEIYRLNGTAARFWELAAEGLDRPAVESRLHEEFAVEADDLESEIDALVRNLVTAELAEVRD